MKPSEAIRRGCLLIQNKSVDDYFNWEDGEDVPKATCAIGAMAMGYDVCPVNFRKFSEEHYSPPMHDFLVDTRLAKTSFPKGVEKFPSDMEPSFSDALIHLNDNLEWTREEIADWLESIGY